MANPPGLSFENPTREVFIQSIDAKQNTYLHAAAKSAQNIEALGQILSLLQPGDINIQNVDGWTPLHGAVWEGQEAVAKMLLTAGADPNIKVKLGPVTDEELQANARQRYPVAEVELAKARVGYTALHFAALRQFRGLAKALIDHGANVNEVGGVNKNNTALLIAIQKSDKVFAEMLCARGAPALTGKQIREAVEAVQAGDLGLLKTIVETLKRQQGYLTYLELALCGAWKSPEIIDYLLKLGVNPNNPKRNLAGYLCHIKDGWKKENWDQYLKLTLEGLRVLLNHKGANSIDVNARWIYYRSSPADPHDDSFWWDVKTPLETALRNARWEHAQLLIDNGGKVSNTNYYLTLRSRLRPYFRHGTFAAEMFSCFRSYDFGGHERRLTRTSAELNGTVEAPKLKPGTKVKSVNADGTYVTTRRKESIGIDSDGVTIFVENLPQNMAD